MLRRFALTLTTLAGCLSAAAALADATFEITQSAGGPASYQVRQGLVRMSMTGPQGQTAIVIYDSRQQTVTNILPQQQVYTQMDREAMRRQQQQLQSQMQQMLPQMEQQMRQQMQSMPAEQQRMMEQRLQAMRRTLGGAEPIRLQSRPTGRKESVGGITCEIHEVLEQSQPVGSACVANAAQLGIGQADFDAITGMFAFMQKMNSGMADKIAPEFPGVPLRVSGPDGQVVSELKQIRRDALASELFQIPAGYSRMDPSQGSGGMR